MATSSRPRRSANRRSLDYQEGLLHEEELAIRRALQASLLESKTTNDEPGSSNIHIHKQNSSNRKQDTSQHNNNHLINKLKKNKKKRLKDRQDSNEGNDGKATTAKKKIKHSDSHSSRSRSSSVNSSDSVNSLSSTSTRAVSSASSQTKLKCNKILNGKATVKVPKKDKLGVKIRKKMMKKKLKAVRNGSDCESTMSGSTTTEVVTLKKTRRSRKKKNEAFVQKKFASITPSPSKMSISTAEIDTSVPLAKAEDFIDFLCLRGNSQMPKNLLEAFNNPFNTPSYDEEYPCSPPSSSLSELPSSPSPSLPTPMSVDSTSCDTPTFDTLPEFDDGLHAMRMYAGIENKRKDVDDGSGKQEIAVADIECEEEASKSTKSITPPLSFRISPRPTPPLTNSSNTSGFTILPSPVPRMTMSPSSTGSDRSNKLFYPTPDSPAFGPPPPLMLGQVSGSASDGCCSPPPLLYIPAAAQRVTHLHGPPKLERVQAPEEFGSVSDSPPLLTRHGQHNSELSSDKPSDKVAKEEGLHAGRPSSAVDFTASGKDRKSGTSNEELNKEDNSGHSSYTRNTKSCPLRNSSDILRLEKVRRDLNVDTNSSYSTGLPFSPLSSQASNTDVTQVGHNTRNHDACTVGLKRNRTYKSSSSSTLDVESPDSAISLGTNSLLENLQRAHDNISGLMSPSETVCRETASSKSAVSNSNLSQPLPTSRSQAHTINSIVEQRSDSTNHSSFSSFSRVHKNNQQEQSYSRPSTISEPFIGEQPAGVIPFEPGRREGFLPPWSAHLHASYRQTTNPPRPYTLSLSSSYNSLQNPITPRSIPVVPANKVPIISSNKHISIPFNKDFLHKAAVNQNYSIPNAFARSSPRQDGIKSSEHLLGNMYHRGIYQSNGINASYNDASSSHNVLTSGTFAVDSLSLSSPRGSSTTRSEMTSNLNLHTEHYSKNGCRQSQSQKALKGDISSHQNETGSSNSNHVKSSLNTSDKSPLNSEVKKRRGRPPGSKNKKTLALIEKSRQEKLQNNTSQTSMSNEVKESKESGLKLAKKKKIECPILRPTDEEFKDPISYLKSVREMLERFGICIIDPPESWKMESHLPGNPRFTSKRQLIHRLQKRWGPTEIKLACIERHLKQQQSSFNLTQMPVVGGCDLDLAEVSRIVMEQGGMQKVIDTKKWNKVADLLKIPKSTQDRVGKVQDAYCKYLLSYDILPEQEKSNLEKEVRKEIDEKGEVKEHRNQCTTKGRSFSMGCFQRTARSFQNHFFKTDPSVNDIEREYWKIVQSRDKYVAAHHVRLDTKEHGSCFPTSKSDPYSKNSWNLNVLAHLKGSILKHAGNVEDLTIPWLNIDMLFSTKRWTTTPLQTYVIDYLHSSNDKVWYGVPESDMEKFPHTKKENTNDSEDGEFMVSPSSLSRDTGLNVTRLEQKQGQFVIISPKVFHCYVSSGYSVSETVAIAFPDWILRTSSIDSDVFLNWSGFSYEKLLLKSIDDICNDTKESAEYLQKELLRIRDREVSLRQELKELGVTDSKPTSTTAKGIQTIPTTEGSVQVNASNMYCVVCHRLCHLSSVLSEEDSELLCMSDAVDYIREERPTEPLTIVTNCPLSQLEEAISTVTDKLKNL